MTNWDKLKAWLDEQQKELMRDRLSSYSLYAASNFNGILIQMRKLEDEEYGASLTAAGY